MKISPFTGLFQLAGATAVQVYFYDKPASFGTVFSLGGPIGLVVGSFAGFFAAIAAGVVLGNDGTIDGTDLAIMAGLMLGGPILFVHFVGKTPFTEAIAMTVGGAVGVAIAQKLT